MKKKEKKEKRVEESEENRKRKREKGYSLAKVPPLGNILVDVGVPDLPGDKGNRGIVPNLVVGPQTRAFARAAAGTKGKTGQALLQAHPGTKDPWEHPSGQGKIVSEKRKKK